MGGPVANEKKETAAEIRGRPVNLSRAARRGIRQAARLAEELNLHSFRTHADGSVTWVRWRAVPPAQDPQEKIPASQANPQSGEPSKRAQKSRERARRHRELHEKAMLFRCAAVIRHLRQQVQMPGGADKATTPRLCDAGDGIPAASITCDARDSAIPQARPHAASAPVPQQSGTQHPVPMGLAGCGSPTTGVVGPPGARPQSMCMSPCMHSPHSGARNVIMSQPSCMPLRSSAAGVCTGPTMSSQQCDPSLVHSVRMQVREQHYIPFMQFHTQQGVSEHDARRMWDEYEARQVSEHIHRT